MRYTDNPDPDGPICGDCEPSRGGVDPTFNGGSSLGSLKGRTKDFRESLKMAKEATGHKVGSAEWKELKAEQKKLKQSAANRKLTSTEVDDINETIRRKKESGRED